VGCHGTKEHVPAVLAEFDGNVQMRKDKVAE
jgi:hypothetical protein